MAVPWHEISLLDPEPVLGPDPTLTLLSKPRPSSGEALGRWAASLQSASQSSSASWTP